MPGPLLPSPRQRRELLRSEAPSIDECVPRSGRLRGHERESARHLGAVLPPHLGFRRSLFAFAYRLRGKRQADARLRYSGAGLPVPPFVPDLSIRALRQGGGASLFDFCNHWYRSASTTSGSLDSPPTRYRVSIVVFLRAGRHRALAGAEALRRSLHAVTGLLPPSQGPAVAFACASRVHALSALSRLVR